MKITEKASPITSPRIVALVNRPFTQYRTRIPTVPSGLATLIVGPGPRPSLQSTAGTRLLVSHRSQYSPYAEDSQYRPPPQVSDHLLSLLRVRDNVYCTDSDRPTRGSENTY